MKKLTLSVIFLLLLTMGVSVSANHIPVLLYHDVQQQYEPDRAVITITPERFDEHVAALLSNGYTPISFEDVYNASQGNFAMPEKPVIISFDDGYLTNYSYAFPVIQKYGVKTTIFVVAGTVGQTVGVNPHFTWEQAQIMQQSGLVSIQSHTLNHYDLTTLDKFRLERELRLSKYLVEKNLGTDCDILAFPFGSYSRQVIDSAKNAGYKIVAEVGETGINTVTDVKTKPLVRVTVYGSWTGEELIMMMQELAIQ